MNDNHIWRNLLFRIVWLSSGETYDRAIAPRDTQRLGRAPFMAHTLIKRLGILVHSFCGQVSTYPSLEVAYEKIRTLILGTNLKDTLASTGKGADPEKKVMVMTFKIHSKPHFLFAF